MRNLLYLICGGIIAITTLVLLITKQPTKASNIVGIPTPPPPQYTLRFDYSDTNGQTVAIYFKTPIVSPSHFHIEPMTAENHEIDLGEGDTIISENNMMMQRNIKTNMPTDTYRIRYKDCSTQNDCEVGFFYTTIKKQAILDKSMDMVYNK